MSEEKKETYTPCPFCGSQPKFLLYGDGWHISCGGTWCLIFLKGYLTRIEAVEVWEERFAFSLHPELMNLGTVDKKTIEFYKVRYPHLCLLALSNIDSSPMTIFNLGLDIPDVEKELKRILVHLKEYVITDPQIEKHVFIVITILKGAL